jgi:hypothetical protein
MATSRTQLPGKYFAHGDRSWTDLVTNSVLLSGFDVSDYLAKAATRDFPIDLLGPILHEITHHSCFDSVVGCALSALHMRARRYAFLTECCEAADTQRVLEDLIRYETATRLLRPLSEGLALFAEFDVIPGASKALSPVVGLATFLFGTHTDMRVSYNVLLQQLRFRKQFVRRKAALLAEPFSCESGYLPGYMAVKYLWRNAMGRSERACDSDLFFSYLRSFFFGDPNFAAVILDTSTSEIESARAISNYFQERIDFLLKSDLDEALQEFEEWVVGTDPSEDRGLPQGIGADEIHESAARNSILDLIASQPRHDDYSLTLAAHDYMILEERALLHLGNKPVKVEVRAPAEVAVTDDAGNQLPVGKLVADIPPGAHDGRLSVVFSTDQTQFAFVVVLGKAVAVARPLIGGEGARWDLLCRSAVNRPVSEDLYPTLEGALNLVRERDALALVLNHTEAQGIKVADGIYTQLAVDRRKIDCEPILNVLRASGYFGLVGHDFSLLEALAAIGLANTVTEHRQLMRVPLIQMGVSLGNVEEKLEDCSNRFGERLILGDKESLSATI